MKAGVKLLGHPVHPMLIVFPLGLLATAAAFDTVSLVQDDPSWYGVSYWMIAAGIVGGLLAAVFGLIDWIAIPARTRAKSIGLLHGGTNVLVVLLFVVSWLIRTSTDGRVPGTAGLVCSFFGVVLALVGGWLGGELVDRLGIGVDPGAHANASSSLSGRPARESESRPNLPRVA